MKTNFLRDGICRIERKSSRVTIASDSKCAAHCRRTYFASPFSFLPLCLADRERNHTRARSCSDLWWCFARRRRCLRWQRRRRRRRRWRWRRWGQSSRDIVYVLDDYHINEYAPRLDEPVRRIADEEELRVDSRVRKSIADLAWETNFLIVRVPREHNCDPKTIKREKKREVRKREKGTRVWTRNLYGVLLFETRNRKVCECAYSSSVFRSSIRLVPHDSRILRYRPLGYSAGYRLVISLPEAGRVTSIRWQHSPDKAHPWVFYFRLNWDFDGRARRRTGFVSR